MCYVPRSIRASLSQLAELAEGGRNVVAQNNPRFEDSAMEGRVGYTVRGKEPRTWRIYSRQSRAEVVRSRELGGETRDQESGFETAGV
jgi:hypothetical protein